MKTIKEFQLFLINRGLGTDHFVQFAGHNIVQIIMRLSILSPLLVCCVMELMMCLRSYNIDYVKTLNTFGLLLTFLSGFLIYTCLIIKSKEIVELFNYLDSLIVSSNQNIFIEFWYITHVIKSFYNLKGLQLSTAVSHIYYTRNKNIKKIIRITFCYGYQAVILVHCIPVVFPILYAIIGYPSPDFWFTPYAIHNV